MTNMLEGKVVIITGGAGGIGRVVSNALASEGASIVVADMDFERTTATCKEICNNGYKDALAIQTDVTSEEETQAMAEFCYKEFGRIDALLNIAAYYEGLKKQPFDKISSDEWDLVMRVNVKGVWHCSKAVFPYMRLQGKGKIVNISSSAFFSGIVGFPHYVASKGAVIGLTRALARELGEYNITVNSVAPGYTDTEASFKINPKGFSEVIANGRAIKRVEKPSDLVGTLVFLCSDGSDFITGQTIIVDGGFTLH